MPSSMRKKFRASKPVVAPPKPAETSKSSSKAKSPTLPTAKPNSKSAEEGPSESENDELPLQRTLRLTGKARTWSAAELPTSDSETSDIFDDPYVSKGTNSKSQPLIEGTAKESPQQSTIEPSAQASSSKQPAQTSKKCVKTARGGKPVGQTKMEKKPQNNPVQRKNSCGKTSLSSAKSIDAAVSSNTAPLVKKADVMQSEPAKRNVKAISVFQYDRPVRLPLVKEEGSPYNCSVRGCPSSTGQCFIGLWLFALPSEESSAPLRSAWLKNVPIDPEINRPRSPRVCFQHFAKDDFVTNKNRLVGLNEKAVPSVGIPKQAIRPGTSYNFLVNKLRAYAEPTSNIGSKSKSAACNSSADLALPSGSANSTADIGPGSGTEHGSASATGIKSIVRIKTGAATGSGSLIEALMSEATDGARITSKPVGQAKAGVGSKIFSAHGRSSTKKVQLVSMHKVKRGPTAENTSNVASTSVFTGGNETDSLESSATLKPVTKPKAIHGAKTALIKNSGSVHKGKSKSAGDSRMVSMTGSSSKVKTQSMSTLETKAGQISNMISKKSICSVLAVSSETGETSSVSSGHSKSAATAGSIDSSSNSAHHFKCQVMTETGPMSECVSKPGDHSISVVIKTESVASDPGPTSQLEPATMVASASTLNISKPVTTAVLNGSMVMTLEKEPRTSELTGVEASNPYSTSQSGPITVIGPESTPNSSKPATAAVLNGSTFATLEKDPWTSALTVGDKQLLATLRAECSSNASSLSAVENTPMVVVKQELEETELFPTDLDGSVTLGASSETHRLHVKQTDGAGHRSLDLCLLHPSDVLAHASLCLPFCLPSTSKSWDAGAAGAHQPPALSDSIGATCLTGAPFGQCRSSEPAYAVPNLWDRSQGSTLSFQHTEVLSAGKAFTATNTKSSLSQNANELTLGRAAASLSSALHMSSGQKRNVADWHGADDEAGACSQAGHISGSKADFAFSDQQSTSTYNVDITQESGTGASQPELSVQQAVPFQARSQGGYVLHLKSGSACSSFSSASSNASNKCDGGLQSEASGDEWVPFDPAHGKYVIEKEYLGERDDFGLSAVYCTVVWLPTSGDNGKSSSGSQSTG